MSKLTNYSELARQIGLNRETFRKKRKRINGCKITEREYNAIAQILENEFKRVMEELRHSMLC